MVSQVAIQWTGKRMNERAIWYGLIGAAITAVLGAVAMVVQSVLKWHSDRSGTSASLKTAEWEEWRNFREEQRGEIDRLRERVSTVEVKLNEAEGQIIKHRELFVGIVFQLEAIRRLTDFAAVMLELRALENRVREILDMPIGEPERRLRMIGEKETTE